MSEYSKYLFDEYAVINVWFEEKSETVKKKNIFDMSFVFDLINYVYGLAFLSHSHVVSARFSLRKKA